MAINGIAANYFSTGYTNNQATKAETGKTFDCLKHGLRKIVYIGRKQLCWKKRLSDLFRG